jgi:diguanylate cyclase (GGDEF)-like protein
MNAPTPSRTSLRSRYLIFASVVGVMLLITSAATSWYINKVNRKNIAALQLRDSISESISHARTAISRADSTLNSMLITPKPGHQRIITENLQAAQRALNSLTRNRAIGDAGLREKISTLLHDLTGLSDKVQRLMDLAKDPNWVYPMLPFINNTLFESNQAFETAITLALQEILAKDSERHASRLYREVADLRDSWRRKTLEFRAFIIRFAGLNRVERMGQEKNIELIYDEITTRLNALDKYKEQGLLGRETRDALEVMRYRSEKWFQDFQDVKKLRDSQVWRSDIQFLNDYIHPLQAEVENDLSALEQAALAWSAKNNIAVGQAAHQAHIEVWVISITALAFVALVYFMISRSVLTPIARIAEAISEEGSNTDHLIFPGRGSKEIFTLVSAFNAMRKQIHHRQLALEHQALHDSLTGLPNRALLQDRLSQAINQAKREQTTVAFMLLDLDRFKEINDTLGHATGDQVLQEVSQRLHQCLRASDTVARLGGDEFAIINPHSGLQQAIAFVEKVAHTICQVINLDNQNLYVGVSVGIALYPQHGSDVASLIRQADIAMYSAKRGNKDYVVFDTGLDKLSPENLSLLGDLRTELAQPTGQLSLLYQPQISCQSNTTINAEALLRWQHPKQGHVDPELVIRMAEKAGLIDALSTWVLDQAISDCVSWQHDNISLNISINISAWNLQDAKLPNLVEALLDKYQFPAERLTLEITESAIMNNPVGAREILYELNAMGINLSIDDYGTGFSSLAYLKMLPVNSLKIDKSFVIDMLEDENDRIIVKSTIDLAHNLGLQVIAEGVETEASAQFLKENHCDYIQGFHVTPPLTTKALRFWFTDRLPA